MLRQNSEGNAMPQKKVLRFDSLEVSCPGTSGAYPKTKIISKLLIVNWKFWNNSFILKHHHNILKPISSWTNSMLPDIAFRIYTLWPEYSVYMDGRK